MSVQVDLHDGTVVTVRVKESRPWRDGATGRYVFSGDMARPCRCGHALGVHTAGGWDCQSGSFGGPHCDCEKFQLDRRSKR